jgi:outer membrane protein OmpA-like peptidoglycan-associated protein
MTRTVNKLWAALFTLLLIASPLWAEENIEVMEELRASLFKDANSAIQQANERRASLLSPTNYADAAERYRDAEDTLESGGNIESIRRDLERATETFLKAAEQAGLAATTFETVLRARADAESADAENYAPEEWSAAEKAFNEAAIRLENGRIDRAQRAGSTAETGYREAELIAIKGNYLNETRQLLAKARDENAPRLAPKSYSSAATLLEEAETTLETNRYDTDQPRSLASQAKHAALHAIFVAGLENRIRRDETTLEDILLDWEASIRTLADLYDLPVHFDFGEERAISLIHNRTAEMLRNQKELEAVLADRQAQLDTLIQETASMERLSKLVAEQERQKARFQRVEALFEPDQAIVLRSQNGIIMRMIGLNFELGSSTLDASHASILRSLTRAISEYPESSIVIEGHTDAFGSDTENLVLSQKRADALLQYLLDNTPVSPANMTALGYGESRPVANNETEEGRKRNRRIDVVIYPKG